MLIPRPLHKGDTIGLIAPSSPVKQERIDSCIKAITSLGYDVTLGKSALESLNGYLAGSDCVRATDMNHMFSDPAIHAIFCLRGGYGSTRIMDLIDYQTIRRHPKIFIGYSDITSFHLAFYRHSHLVTFHGPMVSSNMLQEFDSYSLSSMMSALSIPKSLYFQNPPDCPVMPIVSGCARGRIVGGCLSLVSPSIGTFYQPDFRGTILFLEDIDETLPRCDKLMQQLRNAGILSQVNGILLGNFVQCNNPYDPEYTMLDFFQDFFRGYDKPVLWGVQSGHGKPMGTIPLGTVCTMDTFSNTLRFDFE